MAPIILVSLVVLVGVFFAVLFTLAARRSGLPPDGRWEPARPGRIWQWFAAIVLIGGILALTALFIFDVVKIL
ncbi:hypothetical protein C882_0010 [Caenispirillum salinarum AK4]|uniref:Uncharacterized protein n=1 Tax=Caenispirillum salinarum AK4 TaxID=1238182 RepID=K9H5R1_9PROT|nr:hypothetical protein [Caenispirillum salinarum]EKV32927.1 hypothetical protein C882_0010 [Caenispirillum salinarum AK4]